MSLAEDWPSSKSPTVTPEPFSPAVSSEPIPVTRFLSVQVQQPGAAAFLVMARGRASRSSWVGQPCGAAAVAAPTVAVPWVSSGENS